MADRATSYVVLFFICPYRQIHLCNPKFLINCEIQDYSWNEISFVLAIKTVSLLIFLYPCDDLLHLLVNICILLLNNILGGEFVFLRSLLVSATVLFVDDDPATRDMFYAVFELWGIKCEIASSAYEAMYKVDKFIGLKMIITDTDMPGKGGVELAQELKSSGIDIPIVALVDSPNNSIHECGCFFDTLSKPIDLKSVKILVDDIINPQPVV